MAKQQVEQQAGEALSLDQRLAAAREKARTARAHLDGLNTRLHKAVEDKQYGDAHELKQQIPDAEQAWGIAAAEQRALESVLDDLAIQAAQREAQIAAEKRRQQAQANLNAAAHREADLMDQLQAARAELTAGVGAIQDTIKRAFAIEIAVRQARHDIAQARVDSGEADAMPGHIAGPNLVSSVVERSTALTDIVHGRALPS